MHYLKGLCTQILFLPHFHILPKRGTHFWVHFVLRRSKIELELIKSSEPNILLTTYENKKLK